MKRYGMTSDIEYRGRKNNNAIEIAMCLDNDIDNKHD